MLRGILAGATPDVVLRQQYPEGMPLPGILGHWDALAPEEQERLELAVASVNQAYLSAHHEDSLELLVAAFVAARQDTVDLLSQFSDERLATAVPTVVGAQATGDFFAGRARHATEHMAAIEEGWRRGA